MTDATRPPRPGGKALAKPMIIAIDGPAGAGKSSVTRTLAHRLGILHLDTGAMYRAATVGLLESGVDIDCPEAVAGYATARAVDFGTEGEGPVDGVDVAKDRVRSPHTTAQVWRIANNPKCR